MQSVVFGDVNAATARVLAAEGYEVVTPPNQACCGALHLHAGRREEGRRRAQALGELFRAAGVDAIAVNAAGCGSHLKEAGLDVRVVDVSELLAEEPRAERHPLELRVAFQDSCHLAHAQGIRVEPRELLDSIPGLERARAGRAGDLLRLGGHLQPHAAGSGARARRPQGAARPRHRAGRLRERATPAASCRSPRRCAAPAAPLPAFHPIELVDASIRGVAADELLATARR